MEYFAGLDVSVKDASVCIVDDTGKIVREVNNYPFKPSRLIYIGFSEFKQNSIGSRLKGHLTGQSGNLGISNYAARHDVQFTYQSLAVLRVLGVDLYEFEYLFLADFQKHYGSFPICNGQAGASVISPSIEPSMMSVDWKSFDVLQES